eukprot:1161266-Pelagomonas_calceolata.AAC.7
MVRLGDLMDGKLSYACHRTASSKCMPDELARCIIRLACVNVTPVPWMAWRVNERAAPLLLTTWLNCLKISLEPCSNDTHLRLPYRSWR